MSNQPTNRTPSAAIYLRVSTRGQEDGASLPDQEEQCRRYAAERELVIDSRHVYVETYSATELWERPILTKLRDAMRRREISHLIIFRLDRFSRDPGQQQFILEEMAHYGAELHSVRDELENTDEGKLITFLKGYANKKWHANILESTRIGRERRLKDGKLPVGQRAPYGYQWNADRTALFVDPLTAPVVHRIFQMYLDGASMRSIGKALQEDGIRTPTDKEHWHANSIRGILRHPYYMGTALVNRWKYVDKRQERRSQDEWVELPEGTVPAIVSKHEWHAVQELLERNRHAYRRTAKNPEAALLREGFVYCGYCGRAVHVQPGKLTQYRCTGYSQISGSCEGMPAIACHKLDREVWSTIQRLRANPQAVIDRLKEQLGEDPTEHELAEIERQIKRHKDTRDRLVRRVGIIENDDEAALYMVEVRKHSEQIAQLEDRQDTIVAQTEQRRAARIALLGFFESGMHSELHDLVAQYEWEKEQAEPPDWADVLDADEYREWVERGRPEPVIDEEDDASGREPSVSDHIDNVLDAVIGDTLSWDGKRAIMNRMGVRIKLYKASDPVHDRWEMETALNLDPSMLLPSSRT